MCIYVCLLAINLVNDEGKHRDKICTLKVPQPVGKCVKVPAHIGPARWWWITA